MILIYKGAGILVAFIWFGSILAGDPLARMVLGPNATKGLCNLTGEWLAATLTLAFALVLRNQHEARLDPRTGQVENAPVEHSLFFIPVMVWPLIFFVLGILVAFA